MGAFRMRALKISIAIMTTLIVVGVVVLIMTITQRLSVSKPTAPSVLDEPEGTHIAQISAAGDRLSLLLQGGGPDRVVVLDLRAGRVLLRTGLSSGGAK